MFLTFFLFLYPTCCFKRRKTPTSPIIAQIPKNHFLPQTYSVYHAPIEPETPLPAKIFTSYAMQDRVLHALDKKFYNATCTQDLEDLYATCHNKKQPCVYFLDRQIFPDITALKDALVILRNIQFSQNIQDINILHEVIEKSLETNDESVLQHLIIICNMPEHTPEDEYELFKLLYCGHIFGLHLDQFTIQSGINGVEKMLPLLGMF